MNQAQFNIACVGLRAKTGRAVSVVLAGPCKAPQPITRSDIVLATAEKPSLFQPYHEVMELPWDRAVEAARKAEHALDAIASVALSVLIADLQTRRLTLRCVGIVGAPERNLAAIGSPHIRAHAAEGVHFARFSRPVPQRTMYVIWLSRNVKLRLLQSLDLRYRQAHFATALPSSGNNWGGRGERTKRQRQWQLGLLFLSQMRPNPAVNTDARGRGFASAARTG